MKYLSQPYAAAALLAVVIIATLILLDLWNGTTVRALWLTFTREKVSTLAFFILAYSFSLLVCELTHSALDYLHRGS